MPEYIRLDTGDPAPWFRQRSSSRASYAFDTAAGRHIVLCFFGTASDATGQAMLKILREERALFDDDRIAFFGVSVDGRDETSGALKESLPGIRFFWDSDRSVSRLYGAAARDAGATALRRFWIVLDPGLTVSATFAATGEDGGRGAVATFLKSLPGVDREAVAPVIALSSVLEPDLCERLIRYYDTLGGTESGFMREVDGKTVPVHDHSHKRRSDCTIDDEPLRLTLQRNVQRRVVPAIKKIHQFDVTRMERYIVACYDSATGGHFRPHRDNTTKGTAHRRFAMSINLNADFEGGELCFPEYGRRTYKPPPGGAIVFSCSLLHMVTPVTHGRRFAFLPFLYDETAATQREANNQYLEGAVAYKR